MATKSKNQRTRVELYLMAATICLAVAGAWVALGIPEAAQAKGKPVPVLWDAGFVSVPNPAGPDDFGSEIEMPFGTVLAAESHYRTTFGTGNVVVTLSTGEVLDQRPFLNRSDSGDSISFKIGLQDGHPKKDRYRADFPFPGPEKVWNTGEPDPGPPSLEVVEGNVDADLNMLPGAHVILHFHVSGLQLTKIQGSGAGDPLPGTISIGDIEFTVPQ